MASSTIEWKTSEGLIPYAQAMETMEKRVDAIIKGEAPEMVWLLEHPPLFTAGTSADEADLLNPEFPLYHTGRGGQITYHGPGQRIGYVMLDLKKRNADDIRAYVKNLEQWIINSLAILGVESFTREGRVGVWTMDKKQGECKIAALGIRVRKWVTFHGISLNVSPDLIHYRGIVPCGIQGYGITSLQALDIKASMQDVDKILKEEFAKIFG